MLSPIQFISTDFDGTLHAEFEDPPVPRDLQELIGELQRQGAKCAINTGRDLSSVMEGIARARLSIRPDCLVAANNEDADAIQAFLEDYLQSMPELAFVRNGVYARFSHTAYNKGTALA